MDVNGREYFLMNNFFVGLDLGQRMDPSAIALVETVDVAGELDPVRFEKRVERQFLLRHLERAPLGTPYVEIVRRVKEVIKTACGDGTCKLVVDATGVGAPVVELLQGWNRTYQLIPVVITAGEQASWSRGQYRVPKRDLIMGLQLLFEQGQVRMAGHLPEVGALVKELMGMRVKVSPEGRDTYAAGAREGPHDDMVLAMALACWEARKG
jgi:hypothetical protein